MRGKVSNGKEENSEHRPVLLREVIDLLQVREGGKYIDATVGFGGQANEIVNRGGIVLGIDQDRQSLQILAERQRLNILPQDGTNRQTSNSQKLTLALGNFNEIEEIADSNGFTDVYGILFDLGLSSWQIEKAGRGFSYLRDEPLDMRLDPTNGETASELLNTASREELYEFISKFSEERHSRRIADAVDRARPLKTTAQLREAIKECVSDERQYLTICARIFQAVRIAVNDELTNLREGLPQALNLLRSEGRVLVISFHSLEDRIVKQQYRGWERKEFGRIITKKPITASKKEIKENIRARSAKLRVFEKVGESVRG